MDLGKAVKKSVIWSSFGSSGSQLLRFGASVMLARLLEPADYGVMAIATMLLLYGRRVSEFGFAAALIRNKAATEKHFNSVFCVNLALYAAMVVAVNAVAPYASDFFANDNVESVLRLMSVNFLLTSVTSVTLAKLKKEFKFREFWLVALYSSFVGLGTAIILALAGFGVWSLVVGELATTLTEIVGSVWFTGWVPRIRYSHSAMKDTFSFGAWFFVKSQLEYLSENADLFIIGRFFGAHTLGFYERALRLMWMPRKQISRPINTILYSAFSEIQDNPEKLREVYRKAMLPLTLVIYPLLAGLGIVAPYFAVALYGPQWAGIVAPLQILIFAGAFQANNGMLSSLIVANNYVRLHVRQQLIGLLVLGTGCAIGVQFGVEGIAGAIVLHSIVMMLIFFQLTTSITPLRWSDFWYVQRHAVFGSALMAAILAAFDVFVLQDLAIPMLLKLLIQTAAGALVYVTVILCRDIPEITELRLELLADFRRFVSTVPLRPKRSTSR